MQSDTGMVRDLKADLHTHTLMSGHAYGTIRENARAAAETGLELLGITDHGPGIPGACDPFYFCNFHVVPKEIFGVRVLFGCEINVLPGGRLSLEDRLIDKLDFAIVGIHDLCYENAGRDKNAENLIACMKNEKVKLVSHPDDDHTPLNYEMLVQGARDWGVALEVNNSSLGKPDQRLNCVENYKTMLPLCARYGVPIAINSDAHDPSAVGVQDAALALVESVGFPPELILNNDTEKALGFLGVR